MRQQLQPNRWSCFPTAAAIVTDIPVARLLGLIGHDGSEPVFSTHPAGRAFHPNEVALALLECGWSLIGFDVAPVATNGASTISVSFNFQRLLYAYSGVLLGFTLGTGLPHAVAYDHLTKRIYDTNGLVYSAFDEDGKVKFNATSFFVIVKNNF